MNMFTDTSNEVVSTDDMKHQYEDWKRANDPTVVQGEGTCGTFAA